MWLNIRQLWSESRFFRIAVVIAGVAVIVLLRSPVP